MVEKPIVKKVRMQMRRNVTEYWRINPQFIPLPGEIIVYTDYQIINGQFVPAIKIGDGKTSVVSLPFIMGSDVGEDVLQALNEHITDDSRHITEADRARWNGKLNYRMEGETLIFTNE